MISFPAETKADAKGMRQKYTRYVTGNTRKPVVLELRNTGGREQVCECGCVGERETKDGRLDNLL